jgi:hypothetical protein
VRRKLTLTIDPIIYEKLGDLPRRVSLSAVVSVVLKAIMSDVKGMSDEDFLKLVDSDPDTREVHLLLQDKLGPYLEKYLKKVPDASKKTIKKSGEGS